MTEHAARGSLLQVDTTGAGAWATIAQCRNIELGMVRDRLRVSNHDTSTTHKTVGGLEEVEVTFEIIYDPALTSHNASANGLGNLYQTNAEKNFRIQMAELPGTPSVGFVGRIFEHSLSFPSEEALSGRGTILASSQPTLPS